MFSRMISLVAGFMFCGSVLADMFGCNPYQGAMAGFLCGVVFGYYWYRDLEKKNVEPR